MFSLQGSESEQAPLHPAWAVPVLAALAWHGVSVVQRLGCDYLLSLCLLANGILAAGILTRSGLLTGVGFGWALIALPLWLHVCFRSGGVAPSSVALHGTGVVIGFLAVRRIAIPPQLALAAVPIGLLSVLLARLFTRPELNINAAFRVQDGWTSLFPNYPVYLAVQIVIYSVVFSLVPRAGGRAENRPPTSGGPTQDPTHRLANLPGQGA